MTVESRAWGKFEVLLDEPTFKVKRITVKPGHNPQAVLAELYKLTPLEAVSYTHLTLPTNREV